MKLKYIKEITNLKKGVTLIELIISLFIVSVIVTIEFGSFSNSIKNYKEVILNDREEVYSREALRFIESEIIDVKNKIIKIENNKLVLKKYNGDMNIIKVAKKSKDEFKIVIEYDKVTSNINTTDTIVEGIGGFKVKEDKNLIYIEINTIYGDEYKRCLGSNKVEMDMY